MTNTVSHLCGFADTTNTGVPAGTTLTDVPGSATSGSGWTWDPRYGEIVVGDSGDVNAVRCTCTVDFQGTGGTLQNSDIANSNSTGLGAVILRHASNTTIAHNDIHGVGQSWSGWALVLKRTPRHLLRLGGPDLRVQQHLVLRGSTEQHHAGWHDQAELRS